MLKGLIRGNQLVQKAEWFQTLSLHYGIGLWHAEGMRMAQAANLHPWRPNLALP